MLERVACSVKNRHMTQHPGMHTCMHAHTHTFSDTPPSHHNETLDYCNKRIYTYTGQYYRSVLSTPKQNTKKSSI